MSVSDLLHIDKYGFLRGLVHGEKDIWMSHRGFLLLALEATKASKEPVLELGMGDGSTSYLHAYCAGENRPLFSLENSPEQHARFRHFAVPGHTVALVDWATAEILDVMKWSVVLVDHAPPERRGIEVARLRDRAEILVIHDTEPEARGYGLDAVWSFFKYRVDMNLDGVGTSMVSNEIDVETLFAGLSFHGKKVERIRREGV